MPASLSIKQYQERDREVITVGYIEETMYVEMMFQGKRKDLWIKVREPNAAEWLEDILPLMSYKDEPMRFVNIFCKVLHSWNLENEDHSPVPMTREGFLSKNLRFVNKVLKAWLAAGIIIVEPDDDISAEEIDDSASAPSPDPFDDMEIRTVDLIPDTEHEMSA